VTADPTAPSKPNVVTQISTDQTDYRFPLLISDEGSFQDLDLSVKFKAVSGNIDRAGGLVFRLKDPNNYYIVRANALENNYRLYHVVNGRRSQFAGANFKVTSGEWHELRVEAVGNKITCYYDGVKKSEATDGTFKDAGKVGLWTKADSVTPTSVVRLNPDVPPKLEEIINKALEKDRNLRYQHASEMRTDLQRLKRDTESGRTAAHSASVSPEKSSRRSKLWIAMAGAVANSFDRSRRPLSAKAVSTSN
jgi:serine/threonine protein kinase